MRHVKWGPRIARYDRFRYQWSTPPRYLVYSGLVFMPLDVEYLRTWGKGWPGKVPRAMTWNHFFKESAAPERANEETVVLARILQHPITAELSVGPSVLETVDGHPVRSLAELDDLLTQARLRGKGQLNLGFADGYEETLNLEETEAAHPRILQTYGVRREKNL